MRTFTNLQDRANIVTAPDFGYVSGNIATTGTALSTFSSAVQFAPGNMLVGLAGTWTGTVTVFTSPINDNPWFTLETLTSNQAKTVSIGMKSYIKLKYVTSVTGTLRWGMGQGS